MRCLPHPIGGAVYQELGVGKARVEGKEKRKSGIFTWNGEHIEGELIQEDLHYFGFVGGPNLPEDQGIIWTFLPVGDLSTGIQTSLPPSRGGGAKEGHSPNQ